jgi:Ni/Co efflux regulator RcnB
MHRNLTAAALAAVMTLAAGAAFGTPHPEWHQGAKIAPADWGRGQPVDYHAHHLRAPPHGYEWREVDGNYVLAAAATGLIASAILASGH